MAAALVFRQLFCRAANCGEMFFICLSCYRGQTYCSTECRQKARREQLRQANRRYQRSLEARLDHRDRQREYRRRAFLPRDRSIFPYPIFLRQDRQSTGSGIYTASLRGVG